MTEYRFIRPLDVLYLRGNALFGGPGDHGEALMPPWPSLAAGALRARMLVDAGVTSFGPRGGPYHKPNGAIGEALGTPDQPGSFRLRRFTLARRSGEAGALEPLLPLPADLSVKAQGAADYLRPTAIDAASVACSYPLPRLLVLRQDEATKPLTGRWLTLAGWQRYLAGQPVPQDALIDSSELWKPDARLGIALDRTTRTAAEGQIYTVDAVAMADGAGFLVAVDGADGLVPKDGLVRFGGDGRGAAISVCPPIHCEPPWDEIKRDARFRLILASPGVFQGGWRPDGVGDDGVLRIGAMTARLVTAAVPRAQVVSGWDIAKWAPKPAERVAPTGAVYWFEQLDGGDDGLRQLAEEGFWAAQPPADAYAAQRQAEGFNRVFVAAWARDDQG